MIFFQKTEHFSSKTGILIKEIFLYLEWSQGSGIKNLEVDNKY